MAVETFLSINNNEEVIQLPVPIKPYEISSPWNNKTFSSMQKDLNLIGLRGLKTFDLKSFFPVRDYPFLQNREMWGMEYVETIELWRDRRFPLRLIISSDNEYILNLNTPVTIENFTYGIRTDGDVYFTLSFRVFPFVKVSG